MNELERRAAKRKHRMVLGRVHSHDEAKQWDLAYWQSLSPDQRLAAHAAILRDVALVQASRGRSQNFHD